MFQLLYPSAPIGAFIFSNYLLKFSLCYSILLRFVSIFMTITELFIRQIAYLCFIIFFFPGVLSCFVLLEKKKFLCLCLTFCVCFYELGGVALAPALLWTMFPGSLVSWFGLEWAWAGDFPGCAWSTPLF